MSVQKKYKLFTARIIQNCNHALIISVNNMCVALSIMFKKMFVNINLSKQKIWPMGWNFQLHF